MFFVKLVRFFFGYIRVVIAGDYPERFLNLCASNGIAMWNVRRRSDTIECYMFARDYRHLRRFRQRCGVRLKLKRRRGAPFIVHRYRKRKGLAVGFVLFIAFLTTMPRYVWSVNVSGNENVDSATIIAAAKEAGIHNGVRVSDIDTDNLRPKMLVELPELSWAAINIEGSTVTIDVREQLNPKRIDDKSPCNLVATQDGIITAVYVKKGNAAVKVGDAVRKGDLLALGTVEYGDLSTVMCHAMGEVYAETNREITVTSPLTVERLIPTGKVKTKHVMQIFGMYIPLYLGSEQYNYTCKAQEYFVKSGDAVLPLSIISAEFTEVEKTKVKISVDEAKQTAQEELKRIEKEQLSGIKIKDRKIKFSQKDGKIILTASYICDENIATEAAIPILD